MWIERLIIGSAAVILGLSTLAAVFAPATTAAPPELAEMLFECWRVAE